ncbi:replicator initiator RepC [Komagataeibacter melaceti]|uniref:Replicator initiator RepC n=1 Tax=Komagataeibacter melaceti TaxID=2766577 RepID=A0A371YXE1_9PROT|nr:replication initiation protein RepC [Komagataeibacter melaceti]RFD18898.1 replicator initiator RepC [Komagataeibacter melaceti]
MVIQDHNDDARPVRRRGKRTLTPAMLDAMAELDRPAPAFPGKYDVVRVLRALRRPLGLGRNAFELLVCMVEHTATGDWDEGETPFIYAHNSTLVNWTGLCLTSLRRAVRELAEARMLTAHDGRNGQRGRRWRGEDDTCRVGFSLASLRYRWPGFLEMLEAERRHRDQVRFLRDAIADLNGAIRQLAEQRDDEAVIMRAAGIMRRRLRTESIATLAAYHDDMKAIWHQLEAVPTPVDNPESDARWTPKVAPMDPDSGTHYTDTKNNLSKIKVVNVAATGRNRIEAMRSAAPADPAATEPRHELSALRGFRGTSTFYLEICPPLRDLCPTDRPTQPELTDAAEHLSGQIGITHHAWRQACVVLGRLQASITVIIMAARLQRGEAIRYRDAYFRSLVDRGARHALYLDRSLYALRDACARTALPARRSQVHTAGQRP